MSKATWFSIRNTADSTVAEISITGEIGTWGDELFGLETARSFVEKLSALEPSVRSIRLRVASPGGDVFGGVDIANELVRQRTEHGRDVVAFVDSLAASAASVAIMGAARIVIAPNALLFVHNPTALGYGNAALHEKLAADLTTIRGTLITTYQWHSSKSEEELGQMLDQETWLDADAAVAAGLATEKAAAPDEEDDEQQRQRVAAAFSTAALSRLSVPERLRSRVAALVALPASRRAADPMAIVRACTEAGCLDQVEPLLEAKATAVEVTARLAEARAERDAETARVAMITAICARADASPFADGYIKAKVPMDVVRAHMGLVNALRDLAVGEIDASLSPDAGTGMRAVQLPNAYQVYADRRAARS